MYQTAMKMKTEALVSSNIIWNSSMELSPVPHEESFPVIGSCQISSILSNLDTNTSEKNLHTSTDIGETMELIVLQNGEYKMSDHADLNTSSSDFILIKQSIDNNNTEIDIKGEVKKEVKIKRNEEFENMLYFVCNLCPYLCIKDSKITEHLESEHKNKECPRPTQLKCPACPNIFYHKLPLRSHLLYDHKVANSDLRQIIQAVTYFSKKGIMTTGKTFDGGISKAPEIALSYKNEIDQTLIEKLMSTNKVNGSAIIDTDCHLVPSNDCSMQKIQVVKDMQPKCDRLPIDPLVIEKRNATDIIVSDSVKATPQGVKKKVDTVSKYLQQQKLQKCTESSCKIRLQDETKMAYHIKCHAEGAFKCPECLQLFAFWKPLTGHLWRLHKIDMELYSCDICDYKTFSLGKLNNIHKLIHSDLKAFICEVCQKGFKNTKQLRNHKMTHKEKNNKFSHVCVICEKIFSNRRQMRVHMDGVHNKIKPFLCNYCGYKGASKGALKMHIRQHTGEKPFTCNFCNYATADHNSLRRHKLRHTGHKPYKCEHCDYACIQSSTYKVHLRTKHPGLEKDYLFICSECQFKTVNHDMYLSHLFLVHRQKATNDAQ
ncbi:hypothetical protein PPYR_01619 [Photinus pyralis]|uniref:C2H2-type domain-containing protein n=1 Tax=Photinus pyralis TaxID=7054 RepID=A0A1Y1LH69_PHOPY|nr:zinc finger protein ZFMSA12A-like [Photinus pyralis]KAB0804649.1 hypothetical protein PPYR_01619 [Photinus pyralis]